MSEPIKVEVAAGGKASVDALSASLTALDEKIGKLSGTTSRAGEATRSLESELRKIQKAESGRVTAVTGLTQNIDALQAEIAKLGRVGGATALKKQLDSIKAEFNSFDNVGYKSIDEINKFRQNLDQALGNVGAVLAKKRGLTQGQFDVFLDVAKGVDASGKKVLDKVNAESSTIERAILMAGRRQAEAMRAAEMEKAKAGIAAAEAEIAAMQTTRVRVNQARLETMAPYSVLGGANQGLQKGSLVNQTRMSVDDVRNMLGMPSRDEMKTLAAQIKGQMSDALATAKMRVLSAPKMGLDETHAMLGLPSRKDMAAASAELKQWMTQQQAMLQRQTLARSNQQLTMPSTGLTTGAYSVLGGINEGSIRGVTDQMKNAAGAAFTWSGAVKQLTVHHQDLNSSLRGLAQGFGVISAGLSNMVPLVTSFAVASAFVKTLKVGAEFEKSMFVISELAGTASAEMTGLRERVLLLGATTQYGPLEVAKGLEVLTLAGLTAKEAVGAVAATLQFAAAGEMPLKAAAETLVAVGTAYRFSADSYSVVADVIAKTAAETMASVEAMAESFRTSSVVAQQYGISLDDTAASLGALAQIGIRGTAAGTSFRNMITELNKGSGRAAEGVKELGVQIQKLDGSMRPVMDVMRDLTTGLVTKTGAAQQRLLQDMTNERGAKALAAFQAEALNYIAKVNPGLQQQANALFDIGKVSEGNKLLVDAVADAFGKMAEKADKVKESAQGFTFFASLEQSLTPLGQYKGILASLEVDFQKAFSASSDAVYILGARLREIFNSQEFQTGLSTLVSGITSVASAGVELTKWALEHQQAVLLVAGAYLVLSTNMLRSGLFTIAAAGLSALASGMSALATATTGLSTGVGLVTAAKLAWVSATASLSGMLTSVAAGTSAFFTALLALPGAVIAVGVAVAALAVGLGVLIYKWATAADTAEESAKKQREALSKSLADSIKAGQLKNSTVAEQIANEITEKEKLLTHMKSGLSQEEAANKVMGEMAMVRIENTHREIMLQMQLNAVKAKGSITAGTGHIERKALESEIDAKVAADIVAQERTMNSELAKQVVQTEKLRRLNSELAGWARVKAEQERLTGKDDKGGSTGANKPDFAKIRAAKEEHNALRGLIAETHGFEKAKVQEIATLKAVLAQDTSKALEEEKKLVAEISAAYVASGVARKAEIDSITSGVAEGLISEVDGQANIARLRLEGHAADLRNIAELTEATRKRIQTQIDLTKTAHAEEGRMLTESLTKQIALVAKLNEKKGSSEYAKDYETELGKLMQMLEAQRTFNESLKDTDKLQQELLTNGISGTAKLTAATNAQVDALDAQYEASKKELKTVKDLYRDRAKGAAEMARYAADEASALADRLEQLAAELLSYGDLTAAEAVRQAAIARTRAEALNLGIAIRDAMNSDWISASKKAVDDYASSLKNMAGEVANIFTKSFKGLEDVLTDFFTKGKSDFKGFISSVASDMARLAVRQNLISPFVNWISGGLSGAGQSAGGSMMGSMLSSAGGSMLAGGSSMLSGAASTVGGWLGMGGGSAAAATGTGLLAGGGATGLSATMGTGYALGSGATGLGMTAGSVGASTIGAGIGTSGAVTGASTAAAGGGTSMLGAMGPWGWVALAVLAIASQAKGETRHGGQYGYSFDGSTATNARSGAKLSATEVGSVFAEGPSGGEIEADLVRKSITGTVKGIDGLLKGMGSAATVVGYQAGLESSDRGRGGVFSGGKLSTGATFGESGKGNNYEGTLYESTSSHSMDSKEALAAFTTDLMQGTIQALQAASDLPKTISEQLKGVDAESLTSEQAQALVTSIQTTVDGVTTLHDAMETMNLKALSFDAAAGLIKAAGGMDKLGSSLSTYYEKFYSAEEKAVATTKATSTAFAKLGITMPAVNEDLRLWYRGQIENLMAMDQTIEANAQATAGALALAGAVDQLAPAADGAVTSIQAFTDNVKQLVDGIHSSVSSSIFDMQYGLKDNEGKYGMLDTVAKGYDDQMRSAVDINKIAEYAQKEIDTINKAWDLLDPEQQAAKLAEMSAMLQRVDEFVTESGADAISRKKAENQDLADAISTGVKDALADIGLKLSDAALSAASAATSVAEAKAAPAQVNLLITNRAGAEVSIS